MADRIVLHRLHNDGKSTAELHVFTDIAFTGAEGTAFGSAPPLPNGASLVYWHSHCWAVRESPTQIKKLLGLKA